MNPIKKRGIVVPIILFCIVLVGIFFLFKVKGKNSSNTTGYELASTIRLMKIEGEVLVQNAVGNTISSNEQMKLYNGYQIITSNGSYAWLTLDDTKVVKIDANSVVGVQKKNEKITLYIDSGSLFFNVKQPLKTKESFHVKTSTMTMGIRGTSGVVTALENGKSEIRLFTGKVHVYVEEAVTAHSTTKFLVPGNILECTAFDQEKKAKTKMITMKEEDIPSFAAAEIVEDNPLRNQIQEETNLNISSLTVEDISSIQQMEEDSTKEKSKEIVAKEEGQSQVTETVTTDESEVGNRNTGETIPNHSFYDWSTSSNSSYKETTVNKNIRNESNKNTESHRKEEDNQEQKDSQRKKQPSKEETNASSEKQHEKSSTSISENQLEEEITSISGSRPEEGTTVTPENQPEDGTTSAPEKQPEEGTTSAPEKQPTEEGSTCLPNKQPSEEGTTSSTSSENDTTENVAEENTSSTIDIEESTEATTSSPSISTNSAEEDSSVETPDISNRPSWWEEIWGEIWNTIKDNLFLNDKA